MAEKLSSSSERIDRSEPEEKLCRLNPIAQVLLQGLHDQKSELHKLNGMWHILQKIWRDIISYWKLHIKYTSSQEVETGKVENLQENSFLNLSLPHFYNGRFKVGLTFPKPTGLNINMMPFLMKRQFKMCCLPRYLKTYWKELIEKCPIGDNDKGKIGYLTIQESFVDANTSQRRPGIHTGKPGRLILRETEQGKNNDDLVGSGGYSTSGLSICPIIWGGGTATVWGSGILVTELEGGIFMASTANNSCRIWDCQIMEDDLIGELGDIEHLRECLSDSKVIKNNELYWLTDRTPHESLAMEQGTYRQFFRLVTSEVSFWYEDHSTKNPLGIVPDPNITKIVRGSKFDKDGVLIVNADDSNEKTSGKRNFKKWLKSKIHN